MCLAIPGKVIAVDGDIATVDYESEQREAGTQLLPDITIGEYVLVQAKMIVQRVPEKQAKAALDALRNSDG